MVDLDRLRSVLADPGADAADVLADAVREIEEARRASSSPEPIAVTLAESAFRIADTLFSGLMGTLRGIHTAGPSRAERLVRYRCAALGGLLACPNTGAPPNTIHANFANDAERYAHAMLAAEREPSHG